MLEVCVRLDAQEEHHWENAVLAEDGRDLLVRLDGVAQNLAAD